MLSTWEAVRAAWNNTGSLSQVSAVTCRSRGGEDSAKACSGTFYSLSKSRLGHKVFNIPHSKWRWVEGRTGLEIRSSSCVSKEEKAVKFRRNQ